MAAAAAALDVVSKVRRDNVIKFSKRFTLNNAMRLQATQINEGNGI